MPLINKAGGGGSDTSVVTASAADVLAGKVIVDADGNEVTGTMTNNGAVSQTLDTSTTSYNIPAGYHNGSGKVSIATETKTATPSTSEQTITPSSGKVLSSVTVNAMPTATQATPSITVSSEGLITASATQVAGYVAAGTKSATKQLTVQAAKTVTPTTSNQTAVASGVYTTGAVTVAGDANLVAGNIAKGKSIFGVTGTYVSTPTVISGSVKASSTEISITTTTACSVDDLVYWCVILNEVDNASTNEYSYAYGTSATNITY